MSAKTLDWAWKQQVSSLAKLVLIALGDGIERHDDIMRYTGLSPIQLVDALTELGRNMVVIWRGKTAYFRLGEGYQDNNGRPLDGE